MQDLTQIDNSRVWLSSCLANLYYGFVRLLWLVNWLTPPHVTALVSPGCRDAA